MTYLLWFVPLLLGTCFLSFCVCVRVYSLGRFAGWMACMDRLREEHPEGYAAMRYVTIGVLKDKAEKGESL